MEQIRIIKEMRKADVLRGRTAKSIRPRYSVWENVPGAFSSNGYKDFGAVLEETIRTADSRLSVPRPPKGHGNLLGAFWEMNSHWLGDWIITGEFYEKGVSGFKVSAEERDAIQDIKSAAEKKEFDILLVFMFDSKAS